MTRSLSRISLKYQIGLIGLVGALGIAVFGVIYFTSAAAERRAQVIADRAADANEHLLKLEIALLEARRAEKDFLLRLDEKYIGRHSEQIQSAIALAEHLKSVATNEQIALLDKVVTGIIAYKNQFTSMSNARRILGFDEKSGLLGEMRNAVRGIEEDLKAIPEPALKIGMLTMRRHEKDFFARLDPKYVDSLKATTSEFQQAMHLAPLPTAVSANIKVKLDDYLAKFTAASEMNLKVVKESKALSERYALLEPDLKSFDSSIKQSHERAIQDIHQIEVATSSRLSWSIAVVVIVQSALAAVIAQLVSRPIISMTCIMSALAGGDKAVEVAGTQRRDEIGSMAKAVQIFKDNAIAMEKLQLERKAAEERAAVEKKQSMTRLADNFESSVGSIARLVVAAAGEMRVTAEGMTQLAQHAGAQSTVVATASTQTSANVQMVAAATEELASSVSEIGRQVSQSAQIAGKAVDEASKANVTIQGLSAAAKLISNVVQLINDIAGQTNLLALNATIEAARAGEAGKGFAVVASEVKNLATQTARATEEIAGQVNNMQNATGQAVGAIEAIGSTINRISDNATAISAAVEEQGAATQEIAKNVQQAAAGTEMVSQGIVKVTDAAIETGKAADRVLSASTEMEQQGMKLREEVEAFLGAVRSA